MVRLLTYLFAILTLLTFGAQAMIALERADAALLTLGQVAALLYWPDPSYASMSVDAITQKAPNAARFLSMPAAVILAALWALCAVIGRYQKKPAAG